MTFAVEMGGIRIRAYDNADGTYSLAVGNKLYSSRSTLELISGTAALQGPDVPAELIWLYGGKSNSGTIYTGGSAVTVEDGTADVTTGMPLVADTWSEPIMVDNLNKIWHIANAAGQRLFVVVYK